MALDRLPAEHSMLLVWSERFLDFARSNSLWYTTFGTACCSVEGLTAAGGLRYDRERLGALESDSPSRSDLLIVAGTVNHKAAGTLRLLYDRMPDPKWVMAMGACACTGGPFREYPNVVLGADTVVPVDVYVPGCPPRPESMRHAVSVLRDRIARRTEDRGAARRDRA